MFESVNDISINSIPMRKHIPFEVRLVCLLRATEDIEVIINDGPASFSAGFMVITEDVTCPNTKPYFLVDATSYMNHQSVWLTDGERIWGVVSFSPDKLGTLPTINIYGGGIMCPHAAVPSIVPDLGKAILDAAKDFAAEL